MGAGRRRGDLEFYAAHDKDIEKIAIVGELKWRDHGLAFAGACIRKAVVQFFSPDGQAVLRYSGLKVWYAAQKELPA